MSDEPAWVEFSAQFVKERGFLPNKRDRVHADSYHWFVWGACRSRFAQDAPEGKTALDGGKVDSNAPSVNVGPGKGIRLVVEATGCTKYAAIAEAMEILGAMVRSGYRDFARGIQGPQASVKWVEQP